ncbi:hypothetical protein AGMMS50212_05930 [Spirochaetia bacterium]|nr:hypothetical protein AGMMS50212_05930 [Spirochaetia bacterium]
MPENLFRKESMEQVNSPEQLNDYIRVSNPGIWIVLAAIIVFLGTGILWITSAAIPTTVSTQVFEESPGIYVCYLPLDQGKKLKPGMKTHIADTEGTVITVGQTPLSYTEVARTLPNDYTIYALGLSSWNIRVEIAIDSANGNVDGNAAGHLSPVSIITDIVRPLAFIFN